MSHNYVERFDDLEQYINQSNLSDELKEILIRLMDLINAK